MSYEICVGSQEIPEPNQSPTNGPPLRIDAAPCQVGSHRWRNLRIRSPLSRHPCRSAFRGLTTLREVRIVWIGGRASCRGCRIPGAML